MFMVVATPVETQPLLLVIETNPRSMQQMFIGTLRRECLRNFSHLLEGISREAFPFQSFAGVEQSLNHSIITVH